MKNVAPMNNSNCSTAQRLNNSTSQQFNKLASHSLTNSSTHLLTGRENIYFNGAILGMTKQEIDNKINSMRLWRSPALRSSLIHHSKDIRAGCRCGSHLPLLHILEPEILMVDEVLAVGEVVFQRKCMGMMGDVATKNYKTYSAM
jgi:ABC-type polysaccharide/polyol phosphate transport system ATPase subunit